MYLLPPDAVAGASNHTQGLETRQATGNDDAASRHSSTLITETWFIILCTIRECLSLSLGNKRYHNHILAQLAFSS